MRTAGFLLFITVALATQAGAQGLPFDMSHERRSQEGTIGETAKLTPLSLKPRVEASEPTRFLLPFGTERLSGQAVMRQWSVFLTEAQAKGATLHLRYRNSILVAPESSRLKLEVNGVVLVDTPIAAAETAEDIVVPIPDGLLRPGANTLLLSADQFHRTDCSVDSTYALWTDLEGEGTYFAFADPEAGQLVTLSDIAASGANAAGRGGIAILVPAAPDPDSLAATLQLAQVLALATGMPETPISLSSEVDATFRDATLKVAVGSATRLPGLGLPTSDSPPDGPGDGLGPVSFAQSPRYGSILAIDAEGAAALGAAVAEIAAATRVSPAIDVVRTGAWHLPDTPLITGPTALSLAALGVPTREFHGLRSDVGFLFALPSDFFANAYGEALLRLDAAYARTVLPGSSINVIVNDTLATTFLIKTAGGDILRQLPIRVAMRHFRPGVNSMRIEMTMQTAADATCVRGGADAAPRIALFDTSSLQIPRFARLGQIPDLRATAGRGFPLVEEGQLLQLVLGDRSPRTLSMAATVLAQIARAAGRTTPVAVSVAAPPPGGETALFVGTAATLPADMATQVGLDVGAWQDHGQTQEDARMTAATFDRWRDSVNAGTWYAPVTEAVRFLGENLPRMPWDPPAAPYQPASDIMAVVAQGPSPASRTSSWTLVVATDAASLRESTAQLARPAVWNKLDGQISTLSAEGAVITVPASTSDYVFTQPPSFANVRLIAANWFSVNVLAFSVGLLGACLLCGLAGGRLLTVLGRRN